MTSTPTATATDPTLRQGDSGAAVTKLQQLLNAKGITLKLMETLAMRLAPQ